MPDSLRRAAIAITSSSLRFGIKEEILMDTLRPAMLASDLRTECKQPGQARAKKDAYISR
jgi:hypothetical protein